MTLTQTAALTKKAMVGFAGFLLLMAIFFVGYKLYYNYYVIPHRKPPVELPDTKFGVLPKLNLPESSASATQYTYSLDTTTGSLPSDFPKLVKVFFVPQLGTTLLAPDKIQNLAKQLGFPDGPVVSNDTDYHFSDQNGGKLSIDLNSGNFSFARPATDSATLQDQTMEGQDQLVKDFRNYLGNKGISNDSLTTGRVSVSFNSDSAANSSQADISVWPNNLENDPIVTPDFNTALINTTVTKANLENYRYIRMQYIFWTPDPKSASTYPLKNVSQAFDDLKNGQGYVSLAPPGSNASITQVYLGYLETESYSPYIQPVYVFQGPNFVGYVSAITPQYVSK
jgi:hypothetical protein